MKHNIDGGAAQIMHADMHACSVVAPEAMLDSSMSAVRVLQCVVCGLQSRVAANVHPYAHVMAPKP